MTSYYKKFQTNEEAWEWMVMKNHVTVNNENIFCVVDGPSDNFAVVDLETAIDMEIMYTISSSHAHVHFTSRQKTIDSATHT